MADIVERLKDNALIKDGEAWRRLDGGQDLSIGSTLAKEAADEIERLRALAIALAEDYATAVGPGGPDSRVNQALALKSLTG